MRKSYTELMSIKTFNDRFNYLRETARVGELKFGHDRIYNQMLYSSDKWKNTRRRIIIRDNGRDLGIEGREIQGHITVHHINPLTLDDIINDSDVIYDPENLICTSDLTHKAIHYSDENIIIKDPVVRSKNDTCPWKN